MLLDSPKRSQSTLPDGRSWRNRVAWQTITASEYHGTVGQGGGFPFDKEESLMATEATAPFLVKWM